MRRRTLSILIGLTLIISGCAQVDTATRIPSGNNNGASYSEQTEHNVDDTQNKENEDNNRKTDEKVEDSTVNENYDNVDDYIDTVGKQYERLYGAKIALLAEALEYDESQTRELREYLTEVSTYHPSDDKDIIIANGKIYEYNLSYIDKLVKIYDSYTRKYNDYDDYDAFDSITNNIGLAADAMITGAPAGDLAEFGAEAPAAEMYSEPIINQDWNTEEYNHFTENRFVSTKENPFSTFGMDVDTASYSNLRRLIYEDYENIPKDSIRVEEMLNYFKYPKIDVNNNSKFGVTAEISDTPWNEDTKLLKVAVQAEEQDTDKVNSNIVFLIDTSGSMFGWDRLQLVQKAFLILLNNLDENDRVSCVTYAGDDTVRFEGLSGDKKEEITKHIVELESGGGTYGEAGIKRAYEIAKKNFIPDGNNRVILMTDGDLNLGVSSESGLVDLISKERDSGIFLSVFGVGEGNYKDSKMKALADNGNGNFAYIDCTMEAKRALEEEFNSLVYTVAKDAKMQLEFNPAKIKGYRQIGYESRQLEAEDFADDTKDGAEIGSGQHVMVLYEIVPTDSKMDIPEVESKYSLNKTGDPNTNEWLTINIRYKEPKESNSILINIPIDDSAYNSDMSSEMSWAAGVAQVAMILRDSEFKGNSKYIDVYKRLLSNKDVANDKYKAQFMYMLKKLDLGNYKSTDEDWEY